MKNGRAFTLVEIMVLLIIIALVAIMVIPALRRLRQKARSEPPAPVPAHAPAKP